MENKAYNSTPAGQRDMCNAAAARANAFLMAAYLRRKGIPTYDDSFIASLSGAALEAVKAELLIDYNAAASRNL